jgi:hypothetical protein
MVNDRGKESRNNSIKIMIVGKEVGRSRRGSVNYRADENAAKIIINNAGERSIGKF